MYVDTKTGEVKPSYSFGELVILFGRIDCLDALDLLIDLFDEEHKLYPIHLRHHIVRMFIKCETKLTRNLKSKR